MAALVIGPQIAMRMYGTGFDNEAARRPCPADDGDGE
jgi:hypothetical protein